MAWILRSEPGNPDEKQMEGVKLLQLLLLQLPVYDRYSSISIRENSWRQKQTRRGREIKAITDNEDNNTEKVEEEAFKVERKR